MDELEQKVVNQLESIKSQVADAVSKANAAAENGEKHGLELKSTISGLDSQVKDLQTELNELQQKGQKAPVEEHSSFGKLALDGMDLTQKSTSFVLEGKAAASPVLSVTHDGITGTGAIAPHRIAGIMTEPQAALTILDQMTRLPVSSNSIEYVQEVNTQLNAKEVAEGGDKPESKFDFQLRQIHIATVAHFTRVSKQFRNDAPALMGLINSRMLFGVRQKLNFQLLAGDASMPNINGLIGVSANHTLYIPSAADKVFESLRRMIAAVEDAEYFPNTILMNPSDVAELDLLKDTTGRFLAADPRTGLNARAWGLPIVKSKGIPRGFAAVADLANACTLWDREETGVEIFEQDADNVTKNLLTIRAEGRFQQTAEHPKAIVYGELVQQ